MRAKSSLDLFRIFAVLTSCVRLQKKKKKNPHIWVLTTGDFCQQKHTSLGSLLCLFVDYLDQFDVIHITVHLFGGCRVWIHDVKQSDQVSCVIISTEKMETTGLSVSCIVNLCARECISQRMSLQKREGV